MKIPDSFLLLILFFLIVSCNSKKKEWENTKQVNTIAAYEEYINSYPKAVYSDSARIIIEGIHYNIAVDSNTVTAYNNYLEKYPSGQFTDQVKEKLLDVEWENVKALNSLESYKEFISKYPESKFTESANKEISKIELIKRCPFLLVPGKDLGLRHLKEGNSFTTEFREGKIVSLTCGKWSIKGIGSNLLQVKSKTSGNPLAGSFSVTTLWVDQPFEISYNGEVIASEISTEDYNKILE